MRVVTRKYNHFYERALIYPKNLKVVISLYSIPLQQLQSLAASTPNYLSVQGVAWGWYDLKTNLQTFQ